MRSYSTSALAALANQLGADAVVVCKEAVGAATLSVVAAVPPDLVQVGSPLPALELLPETGPVIERDPARIGTLIPTSVRMQLPAPPRAALIAPLGGGGLCALVAWCRAEAPAAAQAAALPEVLAHVASLAEEWSHQQELEDTAIRLGTALNALEQAVVTIDDVRLVGHVNRAAARLLGVPEGTLAAPLLAQALAGLRQRAVNQTEVQAVATRLSVTPRATVANVVWTFDCAPTHLRVTTSPYNEAGYSGRIWVFDDVSALKSAIDAAELARADQAASEERFRLVAENASDVVFRATPDDVTEWISPSVTALVGWQPDDMVGRSLVDFICPDDLPAVHSAHMKMRAGEPVDYELRVRTRDGGTHWVAFSVKPILDDAGNVVAQIGGWRDIQLEVEARHAGTAMLTELQRSQTRLELATAAAAIGIWTWDLASDRVEWDEQIFQLYGATEAERLTGPSYELWRSRVHPDDIGRAERQLGDARSSNSAYEQEYRIVLPDGSVRHVQSAAVVESDADGRSLRLIGADRDITTIRENERMLQEARALAEASSHAKSEFLSTMSHEIRTPINGVMGYLQLMEREPLSPRLRDYVGKSLNTTRLLLRVLNDVLDFSKIEAGKLEVFVQPFDLRAMVEEVFSLMQAQQNVEAMQLNLQIDPALPTHALGDDMRLRQVLVNLCSNAIKFTERGSVTLTVNAQPHDDRYFKLQVQVQNTGIGIPPQQLQRLFQAFQQADGSITRRFGGSGLGLVISQRLLQLMGSTGLQVESVPGQGSRFGFELVLQRAQPPASELGAAAATPVGTGDRPLLGRSILLVEDNRTNIEVITHMLESLGAEVSIAIHGQDALDVLNDVGPHFDLVLMDMQMPVMDGLQATRQIKSNPQWAQLPIVAMTANAMEQDKQACLEAGMVDHLGKPIEISELVRVLPRYSRNATMSH